MTTAQDLASCLYDGMVRHRRFEPVEHGFRFRLQLLYLDLDELEQGRLDAVFGASRLWSLGGRTPVSFHREDHLGPPGEPLRASVDRLVAARRGHGLAGPVRLLTSPRYLGYGFNPVSFYFGFDAAGEQLDVLVAEVTNTPWGERHCYVLDLVDGAGGGGAGGDGAGGDGAGGDGAGDAARPESADGRDRSEATRRASCDKTFHVSPFMDLAMRYAWRLSTPGRALTLSIRNERSDRPPSSQRPPGAPYFQADLAANRRALEPATLRRAFWRQPFLSGHVLAAIHRQAWRLWRKGVPFVPHPARRWPRRPDDPALCAGPATTRSPA